jgi:TRAP-type uncharacterized transport system fused permease subunit
MIQGGDDFTDRNTMPEPLDIAFGVALILLIMEAMRRTNGWVMPVITSLFILYAFAGPGCRRPGRTRVTRSADWSATCT